MNIIQKYTVNKMNDIKIVEKQIEELLEKYLFNVGYIQHEIKYKSNDTISELYNFTITCYQDDYFNISYKFIKQIENDVSNLLSHFYLDDIIITASKITTVVIYIKQRE